jgi:zinc transporter
MNDSGLVFAFLLDGTGGGQPLDLAGVARWQPADGLLWVHLDYTATAARHWLEQEENLDPLVAEALAAEDTRPRCTEFAEGLLVSLHGVNTNPGADPEDMVAIRIYATRERVVSTRRRRLLSASDLAGAITAGQGPKTAGQLLTMLAERLIERMDGVMSELETRIDRLEDRILAGGGQELRADLLALRQEVIGLRRHLAPQREALIRLQADRSGWLAKRDRQQLRETTDQLTRYVEDLDSIRDRAAVANEELASRMAEDLNSRMYLLSLIAGLFLPLGFLTGLLGINVGGVPLAENPAGFALVILFLVVVALLQLLWFRRRHWF